LKVPPWSPELEAADRLRCHEGGDGYSAPQSLAEGEDVGLDAGVLEAEEAPGAPDAGLDLVEDQQQALVPGQRPQVTQEVVARRIDAGLALDGLEHDPDRLRGDRSLDRVQVAERHLGEARDLGLEQGLPCGLAGGGHSRQGAPVEAVVHRDDVEGAAALLGAPLPGELDRPLVGLSAAVAEEDLGEAGGVGEQAGEPGHLRVVVRGAAVDEPAGLEGDRLRHDVRRVPEAVHRPALHKIEVGLAVLVLQPGSVALHHHHGRPVRHLHDRRQIGAHAVVLSWKVPAALGT
jgi:hypothetical protein